MTKAHHARFLVPVVVSLSLLAGCTEKKEEASGQTSSKYTATQCGNGDGYYCGGDGVDGDADTLYYCSSGSVSVSKSCSSGCIQTAAGEADYCGEDAYSSGSSLGQQYVDTARYYLGTPYDYSWANCVPYYSMDCSCLTAVVLNQYGWDLPADDVTQSYYGTYVDYYDLQPGDLVFFNEFGDGISHVGMYSGGGYLVHASHYFGAVVETDMSYIDGYWTARRMY